MNRATIALVTGAILLTGCFFMNTQLKRWMFGAKSKYHLLDVHTDLQKVTERALKLSKFDFGITSGKRTAAEQYQLFCKDLSNCDGYEILSNHQSGRAVDFVAYDENGKVTWNMDYYKVISEAFKQAAKELKIPITWGGDWASFKDGPHIELA
jgi:peptidoglycan L-alanyl-D-glutamate endopeptidase CwlK